jgi:hypothetical protein
MAIKKDIEVEMHLGRATNNEKGYFYLEIKDKASHLMVIDVRIPLELIPDFFSNRNIGWDEITIPAELYQNENHGKVREIKEIVLTLKDSAVESLQQAISEWLIKNNKKGWMISVSDTSWNSKRYDYKTKQYKLQAFRFVQKARAPEGAPTLHIKSDTKQF